MIGATAMAPAKDCRAAVHRELRRAAVMLQLLWENIDRLFR